MDFSPSNQVSYSHTGGSKIECIIYFCPNPGKEFVAG